jgi:hypothetical protein
VQQAESALVFRSELDVMVWQAPAGMTELVEGLQQGAPFGLAFEQACVAAPDFDLTQALTVLMRHELLVGAAGPH